MRTGTSRHGWARTFFKDWAIMARAGKRIESLMRLSEQELAHAGYNRTNLVAQVYREAGLDMGEAPEPDPTMLTDDNVENCLVMAQAELQTACVLLGREIATYPRPIAGCDVQFNYLLAQRRHVSSALSTLAAFAGNATADS